MLSEYDDIIAGQNIGGQNIGGQNGGKIDKPLQLRELPPRRAAGQNVCNYSCLILAIPVV
jgi:hypothetical protein